MTRRLIGIGNPDRGDDAVGLVVADQVATWEVTKATSGPFDLVYEWRPEDEVVIVDAMSSGAEPGTVLDIDVRSAAMPLPNEDFRSSHSFGPGDLVALAHAIDRVPASLRVIGIEADNLELGAPLSDSVRFAANAVARRLDDA